MTKESCAQATPAESSGRELQEKLHPHHLEILVDESGISSDVVAERGYHTATTKSELDRKGFSRRQQSVPGLVIPIHGPDGAKRFDLYRPDEPRLDARGKVVKYEFPRDQRMAIDVPLRCQRNIDDPNVPLVVTEGAKKADAGASKGLCVVDLIGTWNWRGTNPKGGKTALPELDLIAWKDKTDSPRRVYLCFDSDIMQKIQVYRALERLRDLLRYKGADVWIVYLPSGEGGKKVGLDDFFAADPSRTVDDLLMYAQKELKKPPDSEQPSEHNRVAQALRGAPGAGDLVVPFGYVLGMGGVAEVKFDPETETEIRLPVAPAPVFVAARTSDIHHANESVELVFRRGDKWRRHTADRATVASRGEIVKLAAFGLPVTSINAGALVDYLAHFEHTNLGQMPHAKVSSQMGWQGKKGERSFLWGNTLIRPGEEISESVGLEELPPEEWPEDLIVFRGADAGDEQLAAGFHASGTFEGWQEAIAAVEPHPRVKLALYGALAAPLLRIVGAPNFIIDISDRTSTGKTVTLRVAASCWGNPDESAPEAALGVWDATRVWIERASASLNNLPLILDDTKRARHPKSVGQTLYDVASGRGRGRGSKRGMGRAGNWSTVLLSTGEQPATSFTDDGGTRARTLTLWGPPFGATDRETALVVNELNLAIRQNYGHAGPRLVRYLLERQGKWYQLSDYYRECRKQHLKAAGGDSVLSRFADYFAGLALTAHLATTAGIVPWEYEDPIAPLREALSSETAEADRARIALDGIASWAHANEHAFHGREREDHNGEPIAPPGGFAGLWNGDRDWNDNEEAFIAFYPHKLKKLLEEQGHDPDSTLRSWRDRGWLDTSTDRKRYTKKLSVTGKATRMVVLKKSAIEGVS